MQFLLSSLVEKIHYKDTQQWNVNYEELSLTLREGFS